MYEPKPDPDPDPVPKPEVPADGSFSIGKSKTLTVNVKDEYNGEFYYTVEAFIGNPIIGENAKLISGSGQKTNSKLPYCISLNIPDAMPVIYIRVTDPFKRAAVYAFDVIEGDMICNIGGLGTKTNITLMQSYCVQTADLLQEKSFKITRRDGDARRIIAS